MGFARHTGAGDEEDDSDEEEEEGGDEVRDCVVLVKLAVSLKRGEGMRLKRTPLREPARRAFNKWPMDGPDGHGGMRREVARAAEEGRKTRRKW